MDSLELKCELRSTFKCTQAVGVPSDRHLSGVVDVNVKMGVPKVPGTRVKSTRLSSLRIFFNGLIP